MTKSRFFLVCILIATSAYGQLSTKNPLDELKDQVAQVLVEAGVPFTEEQDTQMALLIEEQRQASEDLFGQIMDFRGGVPQGQELDRALAGIQWIHDEFRKRLPSYLSDEQRAVWEKFESGGTTIAASIEGAGAGSARTEQIQQIRINNNPFTTEDGGQNNFGGGGGVSFGGNFAFGGGGNNNNSGNFNNNNFNNNNNNNGGGGGNFNRSNNERTEIIQRGGTGAFHGNFAANFQDESLNARNPFAVNKPPYHQRNINGNFSGPLLRERLTITLNVNDNRQENVGTVKAETLQGPFSLGVTRPNVSRNYNVRGIFQLSGSQAVHFGGRTANGKREHEGVGDFTLPERGVNFTGWQRQLELRQISTLSAKSVYETRFQYNRNYNRLTPITNATAVNVLDAFNGGGSQERRDQRASTYQFGNLHYYSGERFTLRSGTDGRYRDERSRNEQNYTGEFTFSDLESYRSGLPLKYRVTRGEPFFQNKQFELAFFSQHDAKLTNRFTLSYGLRYEFQNNLSDHNNIDPRIAMAYAIGGATVIRAGAGVFHQRIQDGVINNLRRLDGTRQFEILIDYPGWPDPFVSGTLQNTLPSRRVADPEFAAPYNINSSVSLERTLPGNLFLVVSTDYSRGHRLLRSRNLNAPIPATGVKPLPDESHIYQLESTGKSSFKNLRVSMRQRFSVFNITGTYTLGSGYNDVDQPFNLPADNYNLKAEWGRSGNVATHSFTTSVNSRMPFDVYLTTSITANSGAPYNITTGKDDNGDGQTNDRPAGVTRNSALGPRFFNVSFNLSKAFRLGGGFSPGQGGRRGGDAGGGAQLSVFLNANNALNMTNPGTPSGVMTSPFFGQSFNGSAPREIEAGMRFQF